MKWSSALSKLIQTYHRTVKERCLNMAGVPKYSMAYWQNILFAQAMLFILPASVIATLPGITYNLFSQRYVLAILDGMSLCIVLAIGLLGKIQVSYRKLLLVVVTYFVGFYSMAYSNLMPVGILYFFGAGMLGILILPMRYAFLWSLINTAISLAYGMAMYFNAGLHPKMGIMEWMYISLNLVFFSFLSSWLLPRLMAGIGGAFERQKKLANALRQEHRRVAEALQQVEGKSREIEEMVYFASHDLQDPLRMINGFVTKLKQHKEEQLDDKGKEYLNFALDGGLRMQHIVQNLLELSRSGQVKKSRREEVDLLRLVQNLEKILAEDISKSEATVEYYRLPKVQSHAQLLENVMQNLLTNAIKYRHPERKPHIAITAERKGENCQIAVADNGLGIALEKRERVFEAFYRIDSSGNDQRGTGIGLAIVKKSVEALGGKVWLQSEENKGSTFYFTIPDT